MPAPERPEREAPAPGLPERGMPMMKPMTLGHLDLSGGGSERGTRRCSWGGGLPWRRRSPLGLKSSAEKGRKEEMETEEMGWTVETEAVTI